MKNGKIIFSDDTREYTQQDIAHAFRQLGIHSGDTVFVHSQLKTLGRIGPEVTRSEFLQAFVDALIESVGKEGNVIMPTFSYSFCNAQPFDPLTTPSTVGVLTEFFRQRQDVKRSIDPIFSVAAHGPQKDFYTDVGNDCFGQGSVFEKFYRKNAKLIFIGERFDITYMHHVEQSVGVPYRYIKEFSGIIRTGHQEIARTVQYYVRDLKINSKYDLEKIAQYFDDVGVLSKIPFGCSKLRMVGAVDAFNKIKDKIGEDISFLLMKKISV